MASDPNVSMIHIDGPAGKAYSLFMVSVLVMVRHVPDKDLEDGDCNAGIFDSRLHKLRFD